MGYSAAIERSPIDQPPSHLSEAATLATAVYFIILLSSSFVFLFTAVLIVISM
jgi:hypothetical protein